MLHGVRANATGCAPDQDLLTLGHWCAVTGDQHAVASGVTERVNRGLFPAEVGRLGHQLIGLHHRDVSQSTEVRFEAPDALVGSHHRVVVTRGVLVVEIVAVHRNLITDFPVTNGRANAHYDTRRVRTNDVIVEGVALTPDRLLTKTVQESEGGKWFENTGPNRVEVDRRGHDGDEDFVGCELGERHFTHLQTLAGVLVAAGHALEHVSVFAANKDGTCGGGHGKGGQRFRIGSGSDGIK